MLDPDRPPIRCLGLFDTVASVIESGRFGPRLRSHAFTRKNRSVEAVRHAVAIDEKRTMFQPQLWPAGEDFWGNPFNKGSAQPQDVREVWFTGVHGDIGGGYPEERSGLAKLPLAWMVTQVAGLGLKIRTQAVNDLVLGTNPKKKYVAPDPRAPVNRSMTWGWGCLECLPRRRAAASTRRRGLWGLYVPFFESRVIPEGATVHRSVLDRAAPDGNLPPNLPAGCPVED